MKETTGTIITIVFCVIAVSFGIYSAIAGNPFYSSGNTISEESYNNGLSGREIEMDPNRAMAGAPCHVMGGEIMGDCQAREISLEAWKYDWNEPTITVKTGELVRIIGTSKDVTHGMAIPDIGFNMQLEPGKTTVGQFIAPAPGEYEYGCSVNCGSGHHNHKGKLVVIA